MTEVFEITSPWKQRFNGDTTNNIKKAETTINEVSAFLINNLMNTLSNQTGYFLLLAAKY